MRCRPVGRPATQYTKVRIREGEEKKKPECREVAVEIIASSYCRLLPEYFTASEWLSRVPRASYTNTRERMTIGWFPLT